ncbi:LysR family transcriptional regulator [Anaerostipes sp.]|uniref:LysR family transcriptional regulator n=1 Tax=Anaerostipes sp. TaxID=1872530 RepID=UPI0025C505F0|nr:LysR family transcriptional regulator [Anaerostipes sp.]MBS7008767.1 LysR family transcriptional regulator [Anaerostipes sp.]
MEIKNLKTFMTVLKEGGFGKAANKLGYTQSTVTLHMQQLEQELGIPLFEKVGRKMVLTKAGKRIVPYVEEVLNSVEKLRSSQEQIKDLEGNLTIAMGETLLCYKMPPILKKFREMAPKAQLMLRSTNCYEIRDSLKEGKVDLGVFYKDVGGCEDSLELYPFKEVSLTLVASNNTKKLYPDFISPGQKMKIPFIIDEPDCIFRQIFEEYLKEKNITLDHTIELWSIPTIKNLVKNDVGISYLPAFTVQEELKKGELTEINTELKDRRITAVCAHHKNKWISPLMQLFIDLVTESESDTGR